METSPDMYFSRTTRLGGSCSALAIAAAASSVTRRAAANRLRVFITWALPEARYLADCEKRLATEAARVRGVNPSAAAQLRAVSGMEGDPA